MHNFMCVFFSTLWISFGGERQRRKWKLSSSLFFFFLVGQRSADEGRRKKKEKRRVEMEWHNIVRQEEVEGGIISRGEGGGYVRRG